MTRIIDIGEADLSPSERLFARTVTQYPPRKSAGQTAVEFVMFAIGGLALVGLIIGWAP